MSKVRTRAALVAGALLSVALTAVTMLRWAHGAAADHYPPPVPPTPSAPSVSVVDQPHDWVGTWAAAPVSGDAGGGNTDSEVSIRNVVHTSIGGAITRVRLSNAFGRQPLVVGHTTVAVAADVATGRAQPETMREVTFGGVRATTVPPGADVVSDPVPLAVPTDGDLLVTTYVASPPSPVTYHPVAAQTSFLARNGDHTLDPDGTLFTERTAVWQYVTEIDVRSAEVRGAVVALGDSITDGLDSTVGANHRWPDYLAHRLLARPANERLAVLDEGISGNRLLLDGSWPVSGGGGAGVNALARLDRDVLSLTGVRTVIVLEGINDIIQQPQQDDPAQIIAGLRQIVAQAHAHGLRVLGGTLTPFGGSTAYNDHLEATRTAVNTFIRTGGTFDGVVDFDAALRDPADPSRMLAPYDSGDHLHPRDAGYRAMADAVDLALL